MTGVTARGQLADPQLELVPVRADQADAAVQLGPADAGQRVAEFGGQLLGVQLADRSAAGQREDRY